MEKIFVFIFVFVSALFNLQIYYNIKIFLSQKKYSFFKSKFLFFLKCLLNKLKLIKK